MTYNCVYFQRINDGIHIPRIYVRMVTVTDIHDFINAVIPNDDYEIHF